VRYFNTENIPLPKEVKEYHKEKLAERARKEGRGLSLTWWSKIYSFASVLKKEVKEDE